MTGSFSLWANWKVKMNWIGLVWSEDCSQHTKETSQEKMFFSPTNSSSNYSLLSHSTRSSKEVKKKSSFCLYGIHSSTQNCIISSHNIFNWIEYTHKNSIADEQFLLFDVAYRQTHCSLFSCIFPYYYHIMLFSYFLPFSSLSHSFYFLWSTNQVDVS